MTVALVVAAFAVGVGATWMLSRRDARQRDHKRVAELSAELAALADPAGLDAPQVERNPLCCGDGKCAGVLSRRQHVSAPAAEVLTSYERALVRGGWQAEGASDNTGSHHFSKDVGGRRASASVRVGGAPAMAVVEIHLDAESC